MIRNILIIFIILAVIFAAINIMIFRVQHQDDQEQTCEAYYNSYNGMEYTLKAPSFDCTIYPLEQ